MLDIALAPRAPAMLPPGVEPHRRHRDVERGRCLACGFLSARARRDKDQTCAYCAAKPEAAA